MDRQAENNDIKTGSSKVKKTFIIIELVLIAVLTAVNLVLFIFTSASLFFLMLLGLIPVLVIMFIVKLLVKDKTPCLVTNTTLTLCVISGLLLFGVWPSGIRSNSQWKYKYQKAYANQNRSVTEYYPDSLPKDAKDYYFFHSPGMLQGAGDTHLRFSASPESIEAIEDEYAPNAVSSYLMTDEYASRIYNGDGFWLNTEATIYLLYDNEDFNHPHSTRLIISKDHTKLEFYSIA